jgi:hypothetical protein
MKLWLIRTLRAILQWLDPQPVITTPAVASGPVAAEIVFAQPLKNYPTLRQRCAAVVRAEYQRPDPTAADETRWHRAYAQLLKEFPDQSRRLIVLAMANGLQGL